MNRIARAWFCILAVLAIQVGVTESPATASTTAYVYHYSGTIANYPYANSSSTPHAHTGNDLFSCTTGSWFKGTWLWTSGGSGIHIYQSWACGGYLNYAAEAGTHPGCTNYTAGTVENAACQAHY